MIGRGNMTRPPEQRKSKKRGTREEHQTKVEPKRGSTKYLHLQKFIETRKQKKLAKRCTLDLSAEVTFPLHWFC